MKQILILILFFSFLQIEAQNSSLYSSNGKLLFDTTLSISQADYNKFVKIERCLLPDIYNKLIYPIEASDISVNGYVIAEVSISNTDIQLKIVKTFGDIDNILSDAVKHLLNDSKDLILHNSNSIEKPIKYYIPFEFIMLKTTFESELNTNHALVKKAQGSAPYCDTPSIKTK